MTSYLGRTSPIDSEPLTTVTAGNSFRRDQYFFFISEDCGFFFGLTVVDFLFCFKIEKITH